MAFKDFPLAEFLTRGDIFAFVVNENSESIYIPCADILMWYPHNCNCLSCEWAHLLIDKALIHGCKRVKMPSSPLKIVYFDIEPDGTQIAEMFLMMIHLDIEPISLFTKGE